MADIPGFVAKHRIITTECRENKGDRNCGHEVRLDITDALFKALDGWPKGSAKIHVAVTVEREAKEES